MNVDWHLFLALTTAHLLADFVFQSDKDVAGKKRMAVQCKHAAIVAVLSYLFSGDWRIWQIPVIIGLTHFLFNYLKVKINRKGMGVFTLDQTAHLLAILIIAWASPQNFSVQSIWFDWWNGTFAKGLVVAIGIITTIWVGGVVVGMLVQPYLDDLTERENGMLGAKASKRGLAKGGKTIGELERALIFFLVMIGQPTSVAFLIAAKSIFRFGELKDRENRAEAEYITIGTLMSFTWGLVVAWITWWLYKRM